MWIALLVGLTAWLACTGTAAADTKTWVGGGGSWHTDANWSPSGVPTAADDAVVASGTPAISRGDATVGSLALTSALSIDDRTLIIGATATSTLAGNVSLTGTLRLGGATTWSAGTISVCGPGTVENAGTLTVTGSVTVQTVCGGAGPWTFRVLAGGVTQIAGTLEAWWVSIDNDGTLRALDGGTLTQSGTPGTPSPSSGAFVADGSGVLGVSNVEMGAGSSASGTGTIRFAGGPSHVAAGAGYAAGVTEVAGEIVFDDDGSTGALRVQAGGLRRGTGTLTVGGGVSALGDGGFADSGTTAFTAGSQTTITGDVGLAGAHTVRLGGVTSWSAGRFDMCGPGTVENAGTLTVTGSVTVQAVCGGAGPWTFRNTGGTLTVAAGRTLGLGLGIPLEVTGGVLGGGGQLSGNVTNSGGTVAPGVSPRTLQITGDYTQGPGGTLQSEIAGAGALYDQLLVGGTATLAGTLEIVNASGFNPAAEDAFRIVDAAVRTGTFATVTGAQIRPDKAYVASYDATGVLLSVGLGPSNTTRPSIPASGEPGDTIACAPGSWSGSPTFAYAWLRDGAQVATVPNYTLTEADRGHDIVCRVTATNANGTGSADSNPLQMPPPVEPTPTPTPTRPAATPTPTAIPDPPPPPPATGRTVNVTPERGTVTVRLPDGRTVPIEDATQIATGSVIDTRAGAVRLELRGARGKIESGVFSDGLFRVRQSTGARPVTELTLVEPLSCPKGKRAAAAGGPKKKKRRLWGDAKGNFRTRGRYGSAVNTGTKWLMEDRCDRTLFKVQRGTIEVSRNGSRKTVQVKAGRRYVVRGSS